MRIRFWAKPALPEERRVVLERWVRLRFQLLEQEDPMIAIIGAVGRLTDEGMEQGAAIDLVLRILREGEPPGS
jgi:hypothetical protein